MTTQPSESIPRIKIRNSNWNKLESCLSDGETWCVRRSVDSDWLILYWKREERNDRRGTSPGPLVATCLTTGVKSNTERPTQAEVPHGFLIWKVFILGVGGWGRVVVVLGANIGTKNLKTTDKRKMKVKAFFWYKPWKQESIRSAEQVRINKHVLQGAPATRSHSHLGGTRVCLLVGPHGETFHLGCSSHGLQLFLSTLHATKKTSSQGQPFLPTRVPGPGDLRSQIVLCTNPLPQEAALRIGGHWWSAQDFLNGSISPVWGGTKSHGSRSFHLFLWLALLRACALPSFLVWLTFWLLEVIVCLFCF